MFLRAYNLLRGLFFGFAKGKFRLFLTALPILLLALNAGATSDCEGPLQGPTVELSRLVKKALLEGFLSEGQLQEELNSETPKFELKSKRLTTESLPVLQGLRRAAAKVSATQWAMSRGLFAGLLSGLHDQSQKAAHARSETAPIFNPKVFRSFKTNEDSVEGLRLAVTPDERLWVSYMGESIHLHPVDDPTADRPKKIGSDVGAPLDSGLEATAEGQPLLHFVTSHDHKPTWWHLTTQVLLSRWTMAFGESPKQHGTFVSEMRKGKWASPKLFKRGERFFFSYYSRVHHSRGPNIFELNASDPSVKTYSIVKQSDSAFVPTANGFRTHALRPLTFEFNGEVFSGYASEKTVVLESDRRTFKFEMPYSVSGQAFEVNTDNGEPIIAVVLFSSGSDTSIGLIKPFSSSDQVRVFDPKIAYPDQIQWVRLSNGGRLLSISAQNSERTRVAFIDEWIGSSEPLELKGRGKLVFATGKNNVYFLKHDEGTISAEDSTSTVDIYSLFNEIER